MATEITHYQANIKLAGHYFPERSTITGDAILCLANSGTTPGRVSPALQDRADRLKAALLAGQIVETSTAEISPLTEEDFRMGKLTPTTGYTRI